MDIKRGQTCLVAECGINHNGDIGKAKELYIAASDAGADAVKFQLFTEKARPFGKKYIIPEKEWGCLANMETKYGTEIFFSVFDFESVDLAGRLSQVSIKLSFVERRNSRLINKINDGNFLTKIVSVDLYGQYNAQELSDWHKLYCPNNGWSGYYPTLDEHIEWEKYEKEAKKTGLGWSDHCRGVSKAYEAAMSGAQIVEKHFRIDNDCPDAEISAGPVAFGELATAIRALRITK